MGKLECYYLLFSLFNSTYIIDLAGTLLHHGIECGQKTDFLHGFLVCQLVHYSAVDVVALTGTVFDQQENPEKR